MKQLALLTAALCLAASTALALGPSVAFGVHGNLASLNVEGPFKEAYGPGYGGGAHLDIGLMMLSVRVSGDYIRFAPDNDKFRNVLVSTIGTAANSYAIEGGAISIVSGNANVKWAFLPIPVLSPYLTGGLGLANVKTADLQVTQNGVPVNQLAGGGSSEFRTAANVGAGVDFTLGVTLFIEAKYTWIFAPEGTSTYIPVSVGITF